MNLHSYNIKPFIYSNLWVSICTTSLTHLTYLIHDLPQHNLQPILLLVFSFTFFTYNGQRLFRLRKIILPNKISDRIKWVLNNRKTLTITALLSFVIGLYSSSFIQFNAWIALIPLGAISVFYVVPFYNKKLTLRTLPYLKVFLIGAVWSSIIIGIPFLDTQVSITTRTIISTLQLFLFIVAITLPFDIRDLQFDRFNKLKTIPLLIGSRNTIILAVTLLLISVSILFFTINNLNHLIALIIGHLITITLILFTTPNRKELFFAGWLEGTTFLLYLLVILSDYFFL